VVVTDIPVVDRYAPFEAAWVLVVMALMALVEVEELVPVMFATTPNDADDVPELSAAGLVALDTAPDEVPDAAADTITPVAEVGTHCTKFDLIKLVLLVGRFAANCVAAW